MSGNIHNGSEWWKRETPRPKYLYRYRSLNSTRSREDVERVLAHNEIQFSSPAWFNDPFDCRVQPLLEADREKKKCWLELRYLPRIFPTLTEHQRAEKLAELLPEVDDIAKNALKNMLEKDVPDSGVLCFCESATEILLWSHYAESHRGICLKFRENCGFPANNWAIRDGIRPLKVIYSESYPTETFFAADWEEWMRMMTACLLTKSKCWSYESEWRVIESPPNEGSAHGWHKLDPDSLAGVIFGCEIDCKDEREVRAWHRAGGARVPLYRAKKKSRKFDLEIVDA